MALMAETSQQPVPQIEPTQNNEVTIRKAEPKDFNEIFSFLERNFFLDEPLNFSIGLLKGDPTSVKLKAFCIDTLSKGFSFVAEINGHLVGVIINSVINREESGHTEKPPNPPKPIKFSDSADDKFDAIGNLMGIIAESIDLFKRYPDIDSIFDIEILSVQTNLQRRGIAKKLLEASRNLASELKIPLILCMCSSHYSALAVKRFGYQWIYEVPYSEYKDETGNPVFTPEPPHRCMSAYIYPLKT